MIRSIIVSIILFIFCSSCVADEVQYCGYFVYQNKTNKTIKIEGFENQKIIKTFVINPNSEIELLINVKYLYDKVGVFGSYIDSAAIKFNDEKIISQHCDGKYLELCNESIYKNILTDINGNGEKGYYKKLQNGCRVNKNKAFYTFDQSDYDRAVPIKK